MIPAFALRLICGLATVWCIAPRSRITSGFFRIQMLLTLGLSVLAALTANQIQLADPSLERAAKAFLLGVACTLGGLSFLGSIFWTLERRDGGFWCGLLVCLWSTITVVLLSATSATNTPPAVSPPAQGMIDPLAPPGGDTSRARFDQILNGLSSAWLMGAVTSAMLLGHWYLTATGMSLAPLIQYNALAGGAALLRLFVLGITIAPSSNWPFAILRWAGILGPLVLAVLTHRILKYRNTQSATGVLYASTILVFMGEMASLLSVRAN